jgi:hypothetical protein
MLCRYCCHSYSKFAATCSLLCWAAHSRAHTAAILRVALYLLTADIYAMVATVTLLLLAACRVRQYTAEHTLRYSIEISGFHMLLLLLLLLLVLYICTTDDGDDK